MAGLKVHVQERPDGRYLLMDEGRSKREIAKFSVKDAQRYPAYQDEIGNVAGVVRSTMLKAPPNVRLDSVRQVCRELGSLFSIGRKVWKADAFKAAFHLLRKSAGHADNNCPSMATEAGLRLVERAIDA